MALVNKLISLSWVLWAPRSFRRFALHYNASFTSYHNQPYSSPTPTHPSLHLTHTSLCAQPILNCTHPTHPTHLSLHAHYPSLHPTHLSLHPSSTTQLSLNSTHPSLHPTNPSPHPNQPSLHLAYLSLYPDHPSVYPTHPSPNLIHPSLQPPIVRQSDDATLEIWRMDGKQQSVIYDGLSCQLADELPIRTLIAVSVKIILTMLFTQRCGWIHVWTSHNMAHNSHIYENSSSFIQSTTV